MKKIILDTNLWISFLITRKLEELDDLLDDSSIKLIFSKELIEEFLEVAKRPKFEKYFSNEKINVLLQLFEKYGKLIEVYIQSANCRDNKDNFLLNLALESKADYLITGDADLLILKKINKTKIINWQDFTKELK